MKDIELLRVRYLRGPNIWTYRSALEVWLDLGELEDWPSNRLPGFVERLLALLPALGDHHCGVGEVGGFGQRLREGTWAGHTLEHVVIELLNLAGMPTGFGQTREMSKHGVYRMVFRARDEQVARTALAEGHRLLMCAVNGLPFDVEQALARIRDRIDDCYLGPSTAHIVAAATDRRIPHIRLNAGNLVQLGHGAKQRRIWTAETELTSAIGEGIAGDKELTKRLLAGCGVPVPEGQVVADKEAAWEAAQDIGLPVVVKPIDGNHGRGVTLDLSERTDIEAAFDLAAREGREVMVERYIVGLEHRLLVVGERVVAAARGDTAFVVGDGTSTVVQLIDAQINNDPRRGLTEDHPLNRIDLTDDDVILLDLHRQGLKPDSVPAAGRRVLIQRNGNVAIDCTDEIHPDVAHAAALAARVVGLDIAGIDLVCEDVSRPLAQQGGAVVEVNAGPGLLMHLKPAEGTPRPVGQAIVDHLFPQDESGRITVVGVAGSRDTRLVARLVAWMLHLGGRKVGLASRDGVFLGARRAEACDGTQWDAGHRLLVNRTVDAAVFENGPHSILRDGLPYDRCTVGVVTDLDCAGDLAEYDVTTAEQMARVLRTQVDVVLEDGYAVLNADDPRIAALARLCDGAVVPYSLDPAHPVVAEQRDKGGRAVVMRHGKAVLLDGAAETLCDFAVGHRAQPLAEGTLLAAVAAGWALGLAPALIAAGIETFVGSSHGNTLK